MDINYLFNNHRVLLEGIYVLVVMLICVIIYARSKRLYDISLYRGILYFQDAFLWFAFGYLFMFLSVYLAINSYSIFGFGFFGLGALLYAIATFLFIYFISLAGFFLVYSLIWKDFEVETIKTDQRLLSRVFGGRLYLFHIFSALIALVVVFMRSKHVMYISQLAIIGYAVIITYGKYSYSRTRGKHGFMEIYFIAMVLAFIAFLINYLSIILFPQYPVMTFYADMLTAAIFIIFLYGIIRVTKNG